jgi:hypothetical protein
VGKARAQKTRAQTAGAQKTGAQKTAAQKTGAQKKRDGGKGRRLPLVVATAVVVLAAAAGGAIYLLVGNSSASTPTASTETPVSARSLALAGLAGRHLLKPECAPVNGPRWVYPVAPPVRGLPNIVANIRSNLYEVFAIGYSCKQASAWVRKLSRLRIPIRHNGNVTVLHGPAGYYCSAWPDANGRAYAGGCQSKGGGDCVYKSPYGHVYANGRGCTITGGRQAFGWNWNVANRRVVFAHDDKGVLHLVHVSGADTNLVFRYLNGSYQLQVLNTSGIGYLNGFTWEPSPGWSVTGIKSASGADCTVTKAGKITCTGRVQPPSCLCGDDGGVVSVTFTASPTTKKAGYLFGGAPWQFKITKMTPVPYIIPGSPDEAIKRDGV